MALQLPDGSHSITPFSTSHSDHLPVQMLQPVRRMSSPMVPRTLQLLGRSWTSADNRLLGRLAAILVTGFSSSKW